MIDEARAKNPQFESYQDDELLQKLGLLEESHSLEQLTSVKWNVLYDELCRFTNHIYAQHGTKSPSEDIASQLLAALVKETRAIVLTTNFDDVLCDAYFHVYKQKLIDVILPNAMNAELGTGPKQFRLHGKVGNKPRSSVEQRRKLETEARFAIEHLRATSDIIVIGFSGSDEGVMEILRKESRNQVIWCLFDPKGLGVEQTQSEGLKNLREELSSLKVITFKSFEELMIQIQHESGIRLPLQDDVTFANPSRKGVPLEIDFELFGERVDSEARIELERIDFTKENVDAIEETARVYDRYGDLPSLVKLHELCVFESDRQRADDLLTILRARGDAEEFVILAELQQALVSNDFRKVKEKEGLLDNQFPGSRLALRIRVSSRLRNGEYVECMEAAAEFQQSGKFSPSVEAMKELARVYHTQRSAGLVNLFALHQQYPTGSIVKSALLEALVCLGHIVEGAELCLSGLFGDHGWNVLADYFEILFKAGGPDSRRVGVEWLNQHRNEIPITKECLVLFLQCLIHQWSHDLLDWDWARAWYFRVMPKSEVSEYYVRMHLQICLILRISKLSDSIVKQFGELFVDEPRFRTAIRVLEFGYRPSSRGISDIERELRMSIVQETQKQSQQSIAGVHYVQFLRSVFDRNVRAEGGMRTRFRRKRPYVMVTDSQ